MRKAALYRDRLRSLRPVQEYLSTDSATIHRTQLSKLSDVGWRQIAKTWPLSGRRSCEELLDRDLAFRRAVAGDGHGDCLRVAARNRTRSGSPSGSWRANRHSSQHF